MKIKILILSFGLISFSGFSGCKPNQPESDLKFQSAADASANLISTTQNQYVSFPKDVEILLIQSYREESNGYPKNIKDRKWMVLYKDSGTGEWMITREKPGISYGFDECVGENTMEISSEYEGAVLFFSEFEGLSETLLTAAENKNLVPGRPISFEMNGKIYSLLAEAEIFDYEENRISSDQIENDAEGNPDIPMMKSYNLTFESNGKHSQIAAIESTDGVTPKLIWAGDLNGDSLPDMILDLSTGYEEKHLYFFLSDSSDSKNQLKKAADRLVVFDC